MKKCEYCGQLHDEKYGVGRFCSKKCAKGYSTFKDDIKETKEIKCFLCDKIIIINKRCSAKNALCLDCKKETYNIKRKEYNKKRQIKRRQTYKQKENNIRINKKEKFCKTCGKKINKKYDFCCNKCVVEWKYIEYILRWKLGLENGMKGETSISSYIKKYIHRKYNDKCSICGWDKVNPITNKSPLEVEHIDGNWENNNENNLTLLCPNCHSLTPTYKSLNMGRGRKTRKSILVK